jgi:hypothetical protein
MLRNAESAGDTEAYLGCLRILKVAAIHCTVLFLKTDRACQSYATFCTRNSPKRNLENQIKCLFSSMIIYKSIGHIDHYCMIVSVCSHSNSLHRADRHHSRNSTKLKVNVMHHKHQHYDAFLDYTSLDYL